MTIISACELDKNQYYVVFDVPYAGSNPFTAILEMDWLDFELYQPDVKIFDTSDEAYAYGYNQAFGPNAYENDYQK